MRRVVKPWKSSLKTLFASFCLAGGLDYKSMSWALRTLCRIWAFSELSARGWDCGNEIREGARWQGVGSPGLERDGQNKQATGGLKNEWINIQTKVNRAGEANPVSTAGEVSVREFSLKSLKGLLRICFFSIPAFEGASGVERSSWSNTGIVGCSPEGLSIRFSLKNV